MIFLMGIAVCFALSAFFSASEMAFLSTDRIKLREDREKGIEKAERLLELHSNAREFLTSVLIGNNLVNILAAVFLTAFLESRYGIRNEWIVTALLAPVLIVFCETVPKGYGRALARRFLLEHSFGILFWSRFFAWPSKILLAFSQLFLGREKGKGQKNILVSEDEFRYLIEESVRSGVLQEHEKQLVERILDFERIPVEQVMTPIGSVPQIELSGRMKEARQKARETGSKVVLVYEEIPTIIIGILYVFDLLFEEEEEKGLRNYLRSPIFLPKETSLEQAFSTLQEKRQSFALVTDLQREVVGIVHIEDLIAL